MSSIAAIFDETESTEENKNHVSCISSHQSRRTLFPGNGDAHFFWLLGVAGRALPRAESAPGRRLASCGGAPVGGVRGSRGSQSFGEGSCPCERNGAADA